jgi:peptidoglycan hydrolase-like protein with peptidoglycan-binding domain
MHGRDVAELQGLLGVEADGAYGPVTAAAVRGWKRSRGVPKPSAGLSTDEQSRLRGDVPLRATFLLERWASRRLREEPPGSNRVPQLVALAERLQVAAPFDEMGFPWCGFAVFLAALAEGGKTAALGLCRRSFNALYTPDVLAAAQAGRFGLRIVPAQDAWRGDLVLFDWDLTRGDPADHVARLVEAPANGRISTVDGNSGPQGLVALRKRSSGSVRAFARDS